MDSGDRARRQLRHTTMATLLALAGVMVVVLVTVQGIRVGGGIYHQISEANVLTADILPPPQYLVESELLVQELALSPTGDHVEPDIERLAQLRDEYDVRHAYWQENLVDADQRRLLLDDAHRAATEFFTIVEDQFVPAIRAGDVKTAQDLATGRLRELYRQDRAAIDELVPRANQTATDAIDTSTRALWLGGVMLAACAALMVVMVVRLGRRALDSLDDSLNQAQATTTVLDRVRVEADDLTHNSDSLQEISQAMASTAEETAAQASVASAASEQVAATATTVAAAVEEMEYSIAEIANGAAVAVTTAREAMGISDATRQTVARLGESSAQIGGVIDAIVAITEDTNILALNATIEAARAGEAGRGFAVVANEVKELAKQTAQATQDIRRRVEQIQGDTSASVDAMAEVVGVIERIGSTQEHIAAAVEQQRLTAREMATRVGEVAQAAQEITNSIVHVAGAAGETARGADETRRAAAGVSTSAGQLHAAASDAEAGG